MSGSRCDPCPHKRYVVELEHARGVVVVDAVEDEIVEVVDVEPRSAIPAWTSSFGGHSIRHVARLNPDATIRMIGRGRTGVKGSDYGC